MKFKAWGSVAVILALITFGWLNINPTLQAGAEPPEEDSGVPNEQAESAAREKDPKWKPATKEVAVIQIGAKNSPGALKNFCLNKDGNILACYAPAESSGKDKPGIRVYSPDGKLLNTIPVEIKPTAICVVKDGSIFVAGEGRILKLDSAGKVLASAASPSVSEAVVITKEIENMVEEMAKQNNQPFKAELARMQTQLEKRRSDVTGLAATGDDIFMSVPAPSDFTYRIYRFNHSLKEPTMVVEKLRGCCGQMDVQAHDGKMWIPHNARHAVESRDRDGKELTKFGKKGRIKATDFGGCCEPKSMRVLPDGDILAAESGPPTCIKRFSSTGEFKEVVAIVPSAKGECVRVTVERSPDGQRYYMLDTTIDAIRVFASKG